jgi:hypothetical protein
VHDAVLVHEQLVAPGAVVDGGGGRERQVEAAPDGAAVGVRTANVSPPSASGADSSITLY